MLRFHLALGIDGICPKAFVSSTSPELGDFETPVLSEPLREVGLVEGI